MASDTVVVPEGHKVVVISGTVSPHVNSVASGVLVVDYGQSGDWHLTNAKVETALAKQSTSMVVILQQKMIDALKSSSELANFFAYWKSSKEKGVSAVWVLPLEASAQKLIIQLIQNAGYSAHGSAPDGACFVEVHKPDGSIVIGMPGASLRPQ